MKKTVKTKRVPPPRHDGALELLKIVARLKDQVQKADHGPSWQEKIRACLASFDLDAYSKLKDAYFGKDEAERKAKSAARIEVLIKNPDHTDASWVEFRRQTRKKDEWFIKLYKIGRDAGEVDADEAFFHISLYSEDIAEDRADEVLMKDVEFKRINKAIDAANKKYGLKEDEVFNAADMPDDLKKLDAEYGRIREKISNASLGAVLREHGEDSMADLLLTDRAAYADRREKGRVKVHGPLPKE